MDIRTKQILAITSVQSVPEFVRGELWLNWNRFSTLLLVLFASVTVSVIPHNKSKFREAVTQSGIFPGDTIDSRRLNTTILKTKKDLDLVVFT